MTSKTSKRGPEDPPPNQVQRPPGADAMSVPLLFPRVVLVVAATVVALLAPLVWVPLVMIGAVGVLWRLRAHHSQGDPLVSGLRFALMIVGVTLLATPLWLVLLVGVSPLDALRVAAALSLRLSAVFFVGFAFTAAVRPVQWLVSLRRFPRLALAFMLTFRQVPELAQDASRMRAAQQGRGLLVGHRRWRPLLFLVPLFSRAFERADRLSMTLLLTPWGQKRARPVRVARRGPADAWFVAGGLLMIMVVLLPLLGL